MHGMLGVRQPGSSIPCTHQSSDARVALHHADEQGKALQSIGQQLVTRPGLAWPGLDTTSFIP